MFEYKLHPVPAPSKKAKGRKTVPERMAHALSEMLNEQAKDNWEFSGQETFQCDEKSGLMGKEKHVELRYMIFRRDIRMEAMPLDRKLEKLREKKAETMVQAAPAPAPAPAPFPDPIPSPQALGESVISNGEEPTRIFSPFDTDTGESDAPALGPAEKP